VAFDVAVDEAVRRTKALARRQRAWFRRDPRIWWLDPGRDLLDQLLEAWEGAPCPADVGRGTQVGD
jgi:tRNA dimethylallyltransferase